MTTGRSGMSLDVSAILRYKVNREGYLESCANGTLMRVQDVERFAIGVREDSCDDVDAILAKLGLTVEQARTEGGNLRVQRICNHIQETLDALAQAASFGAAMSDKYTASTRADSGEAHLKALAEHIAASSCPSDDSRLEIAYAIARHLKLDGWPCAYEKADSGEAVAGGRTLRDQREYSKGYNAGKRASLAAIDEITLHWRPLLSWALGTIDEMNDGPMTADEWSEDAALYQQARGLLGDAIARREGK